MFDVMADGILETPVAARQDGPDDVTQELHKNAARALAACSEVARLYRRYGTPVSSGKQVSQAQKQRTPPHKVLHPPIRFPGRRR